MKWEELTETFMRISNGKNPSVVMVYIIFFQRCKALILCIRYGFPALHPRSSRSLLTYKASPGISHNDHVEDLCASELDI